MIKVDKSALNNPEDTMWNMEKAVGADTWTFFEEQDNTQYEKCAADKSIKILFPDDKDLPEMPVPEKTSKDKAYLPVDLNDDMYAKAFLALFDASISEPTTFKDTADGTPLLISANMFKTRTGKWFISEQGIGPYVLLLADTIKNPDEVWMNTFKINDEAYGLERTYLKRLEIDGKLWAFIAVFRKTNEGWRALTFSQIDPTAESYPMFMIYFRAGELVFSRK